LPHKLIFFWDDGIVAQERLIQCSSSGLVSATSPALPDERALFIQVAGEFNRGRVFSLGSKAVEAKKQLQQG
jgi:hypothetical protein